MSENVRKDCRTQGKYSDRNQHYDDKRPLKKQDNRQKVSPTLKEPHERKFHKRRSNGGKSSSSSLINESESPVRYEENSVYTFSQLEEMKKPTEIKCPGKHVLSSTENGESVVFYEPHFFEEDEALDFMRCLYDSTNWNEKKIIIKEVEYPQPRLVAWYGPFPYTYSGSTLEPAEMPDSVVEIKKKVEDYLRKKGINVVLNSVLLNLYRDNKDSVAWHSDDELCMGVHPTIASVSLGETRKFEMRRKFMAGDESSPAKGDEYFVHLNNGSLLIMDGCMQKDWQHRVPKEYHDRDRRINLTFRTVCELKDLPPSPGTYSKTQLCNSVLREACTSKADYGINYDDENFPPLNNGTSPVCSDVKKSPEIGASVEVKASRLNGSYKWGKSEISSSCKTSWKNGSEITESKDMSNTEQSPSFKTSSKTDDKDHNSSKISNDFTYHKVPFKTHVEITVSENAHYTEAFDNGDSLIKEDKISESEDFWGTESSPSNNNFWKNGAENSRSEKQDPKSSYNEKSNLNNLNEDKMNVKIDMQNKNLHAYDSNFSNNSVASFTVNARKGQNYHLKESYNVPTNSVNNREENAHTVENEPTSHKNTKWNLEAQEFVPNRSAILPVNIPYHSYELENLITYNVTVMNGEDVKKFTFALKNKVSEKIPGFSLPDQEELEFLCEIANEDQTERNLKVISSRMCLVVKRALNHPFSPNVRKPHAINQRKFNHGNFSGRERQREYQSSGRDCQKEYQSSGRGCQKEYQSSGREHHREYQSSGRKYQNSSRERPYRN